jgi:hypothetical protein
MNRDVLGSLGLGTRRLLVRRRVGLVAGLRQQGRGLAQRFQQAGLRVTVGSRDPDRARAAVTAWTDAAPAIDVRRLLGSPVVELRGSIPLRSGPVYRNVSVDNPTQYFVNQLRDALEANGIDVFGAAVDIDTLADPPR